MAKLKKWNNLLKNSHLQTRNQAIIELKEGKEVDLLKEEIQELENNGVELEAKKAVKKAKKVKK
jgi:hypothetical protein|tara:strand:- start:490 stop:681 length:192 start_codon:yes stop_codon:yes gene_type:complete